MLAACLFEGGSNGAPCSLDGLVLNRFAGAFVKQAAIDLDQSCCLLMDRYSERRNGLGQIVSGALLKALRDGTLVRYIRPVQKRKIPSLL